MMFRITAVIVFVAACLMFALPAFSEQYSAPDGLWEIDSADSQYKVTTCGDKGELCGELVWLGNGADTAENMPYLNTLLIDHAARVGYGRWKGQLHLFGKTAQGTITQYGDRRIELSGCLLFVICRRYHLLRID